MEACLAVEREVDKVLTKFGGINEHADRVLGDLVSYIESLKNELGKGKYTVLLSVCQLETKDLSTSIMS